MQLRRRTGSALPVLLAGAVVVAACGRTPEAPRQGAAADTTSSTAVVVPGEAPAAGTDTGPESPGPVVTRPSWLGTRPLPVDASGYGEVQPTPPELQDRALPTIDLLAPPGGGDFAAAVGPVPEEVAARSTWQSACPVGLDDLRYLTVSFWGFDERPHAGELLVNASASDHVVEVFRRLYERRFPIEEMRVTRPDELDAAPTGDGNNTSAFVCRPSRGTTSWSEHAYGRAVDINPFHNPYVKGALVLPELASAYTDRARQRPGMIEPGDVVTTAFAQRGWGWGGTWRASKDYMHFSVNGR